jgi:hypothetical protein
MGGRQLLISMARAEPLKARAQNRKQWKGYVTELDGEG